jgi:hypothetical protein
MKLNKLKFIIELNKKNYLQSVLLICVIFLKCSLYIKTIERSIILNTILILIYDSRTQFGKVVSVPCWDDSVHLHICMYFSFLKIVNNNWI